MAYQCPQCGKKASRKMGNMGGAAALGGAILPILIYAFTYRFHCPECNREYALSEMPQGTASKALLGSIFALFIAVTLLVVLFVFLLPNL